MAITMPHAADNRFEADVAWTKRDAIIYALATGAIRDCRDERELREVDPVEPLVLPTLAAMLARNVAPSTAALGGDYSRTVLAAQSLVVHQRMSAAGAAHAHSRVIGIKDRGCSGGTIVAVETMLIDAVTHQRFATSTAELLVRGDTGGGTCGELPSHVPTPADEAPIQEPLLIREDQAILYSLLGDENPLHTDPAHAGARGYSRPVLHGLCSWALTARTVIGCCFRGAIEDLATCRARFTAPVFPGDRLRVLIWPSANGAHFEVHREADWTIVLDNGWLEMRRSVECRT